MTDDSDAQKNGQLFVHIFLTKISSFLLNMDKFLWC